MSGLAGIIEQAKDQTADAKEKLTLLSVGIPSDTISWYQDKRREYGFEAPSASGLVIIGMVLTVLVMVFAQTLYTFILSIIYLMGRGFTGQLRSVKEGLVFALITAFIIGIIVYFVYVRPYIREKGLAVGREFAQNIGVKEPFQNAGARVMTPSHTLQNIQSIAVKQAGYIGPSELDGSFDPEVGIQAALRAGVRAFTLQIDYLEKEKESDKFDPPMMPTLIYRNTSGDLISANGANIKKVAETLAINAFSPEFADTNKPLVVYLHFVRTPNPVRKPEDYVKYLSKVAQMLEPLQTFLVGNMPEGAFQRQQNEPVLLGLPVTKLEKKVIFMTNVDTSIFRNLGPLGMKQFETKADLDYITNVRVYAESKSDRIGATQVATGGVNPSALLVPLGTFMNTTGEDRDDLITRFKGKYIIVMPDPMANPQKDVIETLVEDFGVNLVPLNLFGEDLATLQKKMAVWKGELFLKLKPKMFLTTPPV